MTHLAWRPQRVGVIPVAPDRAAAAERARVVGFDQQMEMVVLTTEVNDPEPTVGGRDQGAPHGREDPIGPQATDGPPGAQRDVHGVRGDMRGTSPVRHARAAPRGVLAAGARAMATPRARRGERQLRHEPS
jgi:hypothetical protein